uniref:Odorant binding protein 15 n=1 Tax=Drosicha corpulenta TaxID=535978 RepID=A0A0U3UD70_9HEMI|nr:odorant binding protein 15 [Drosicha corpulenta]
MNFFVYSVLAINLLIVSIDDVLSQDAKYVYDAETECMVTFPSITREFMEAIKQERKLPDKPTQDFKCFLSCVGKKLEAIVGMELLLDMLKSIAFDITGGEFTDEEAHEAINDCIRKAVTPDECELSWEFVDCIVDDIKKFKLHHTFCPTCKHD